MTQQKIIFLIGPTAVGKSDVAYPLADKINGEIISCDSMQIYKEIQIASNKPSKEVLVKYPHHCIDIVSVEEEFDVAKYNIQARQVIDEVINKKRVPLVVGGSGLYFQVLLDGIFDGAPLNPELREKLWSEAETQGGDVLYRRLEEIDLESAKKIHPNNIKKVIRALEVYHLNQKPKSEIQKKRQGLWGEYDISICGLNRDREKIYDSINCRVDEMIALGLIDEIKSLQSKKLSLTAQSLIGVKEILGFLKEEYSLDRAIELMKQNTRHFAKRQLTWFRREDRIQWFDMDQYGNNDELVAQLVK